MRGSRALSPFHDPFLISPFGNSPHIKARLCLGCVPQRRSYRNQIFEDWLFHLQNIRPDRSGSEPLVNPRFYRISVEIRSPPGSYYPTNIRQRTQEERDIIELSKGRLFPSSAVDPLARAIGADVLTRFPKSGGVTIQFVPDVTRRFVIDGLTTASCKFSIPNVLSKTWECPPQAYCQVKTGWQIRPGGHSNDEPLSLHLTTRESLSPVAGINYERESAISDHARAQLPIDRRADFGAGLGQVHPSFDIHQQIIGSAIASPEDLGEVLASQVAYAVYDISDRKYRDKRMDGVEFVLKEKPTDRLEPFLSSRVCLGRNRYEQIRTSMLNRIARPGWHQAYIALGSNLGDRISMIETACNEMRNQGILVKRSSALYETKAMYLEDQQPFINGACKIETKLNPMELLDRLKEIEAKLGRVKTVENGPRTIDLDILMYDKDSVTNERLTIPHKRMFEREFVLRPLCDLIPDTIPPIPNKLTTFKEELDYLPQLEGTLSPLTPLSPHVAPISSQNPARSTHLMAVLNLTPDSFSDGGLYPPNSPSSLLLALKAYLTQHKPITFLDIGGQSTRPNAPSISPEEELSRVLPTIQAIRSDPSFNSMAISIDTYRAFVAAAAVNAGADIINDVSAGQLDLDMLPTIARLGCTCILMHMRGTPETMTQLTEYPEGVVAGVGSELLARVREAEEAGIRRWRIMLDPGIGFAKTQAQNLELLRDLAMLRDFESLRGFPWVVGASRKGFVGKITGVDKASERGWGTAAAVTAAVQGGADVVRVHDVREMGEVVAMADAIWRSS